LKKPLYADKFITHERDVEYFTQFPAPLWELLQSTHFTNVNSTLPYFGPMIYFLIRALGCEHVLELGHAEGYTSYYMAHAIKDNAIRFQMAGNMYYGIDIAQTEKTRQKLTDAGLPNTLINLDSIELTPDTFKGQRFDLIFQDGAHDTKHILHEFKTMWPQLKKGGKGYWIMHDIQGPGEEGYKIIRDKILSKEVNAEFVALDCVYGLGIIRKLDGFDYNAVNWRV